VTINVYVGDSDGTPLEGINVSLEKVMFANTWTDVTGEITPVQLWDETDASGNAQIKFTTPQNRTGNFDVELIENGSNMRSGMGYQVNSLDVNFERGEDKWMFAPDENFTGTLYVYGGDGSPAANRTVEVMLKSHDWTDVGVVDSGITDASGQFYVNFSLAYPSGEYVALIKVDNGASEIHEWLSIQSMKLNWWAVGESSGRPDEIETTDNVIVTVEVRSMNGEAVQGANVSFIEIMNLNGWISENTPEEDMVVSFAVTNSYGRAELKFKADSLFLGEYDARFNVSANVSGSMTTVEAGAWFRIVAYLVDVDFVCPESAENCDPRRATAGGQLTARVDLSGIDNITGETKICLDYVRNMFSGYETDYSDTCGVYNAQTESMEVTFTVLDEQSEYDAVFIIHIDGEFLGDRWEWFKVGGELDAWTWVQPHNTWAGQNTTIGLDVWDSSVWEPVSENCTNVTIVKIIDGKTWTVVDDNPVYSLKGVNKDMEGPNPSDAYMIVFIPNATLAPGEYMAQIDAVCLGKEVKTEAWFRINSFEVSTMMKEFVKANDTVNFWFKVTYYNGTPIKNATVTLERMVDTWSWTTLVDYNTVFSTDHNGEVIGNFTAPDNPGDYNLELEVIDSEGTKQRVDRWFRIWQMDVSLGFTDEYGDSKLVFWEGEDVTVDVVVNDPMTGEAVSNAEIDLNIWLQEKGGEDNESESEEPQSMEFSDTTDSNGVLSILLDSSELKAGFYEADVHVYHNEMGDSKTRKTFTVKLFDIKISGLDSLYITPGEQLNITVNVSNSTDDALPNGTYVGIGIEQLGMKGSDENTNVVFADGTLSGGSVSFTLDVPVNATPGPGVLFAFAEFDNKTNEDMQFIIMKGNSTINVTNVTGTLSPDELFDVNVTTDNLKLQMDPMAMHLRKIGSTISMFELMSSSPESGNEMFYESAIYFENVSNTGEMHVMLQAQPKSGNYTAMLIFSERGSLMMGAPEENTQFVFIDYEVIGDTEKPAVVDNLVATNMNTTGEVELDWSYSSDNVGVVKYKVYYNETDTNITDVSSWDEYIRLVSGSQNSTIVSKLTDGMQYCFA
ncbi:MAG: hypothetical protein GQ477_01025, partial [Nanohaloarchaea archaeon]|nr:hypothetical protein [Candidatus Nanohaloarchaea archaeon]